jgi:hypothetical protein
MQFYTIINQKRSCAFTNLQTMKKIMAMMGIVVAMASCSLTSNTTIEPKKQFVLGNNEHGSFTVKMKNVSNQVLNFYQAPLGGGKHSGSTIKPGMSVTVNVQANTAFIIDNPSAKTVSVALKLTGDTGLSMGYDSRKQ